jgi:nucleotide-binding universal stress UspA family protein
VFVETPGKAELKAFLPFSAVDVDPDRGRRFGVTTFFGENDMKRAQKLLLCVDESSQSFGLFDYIANHTCLHGHHLTLFHVLHAVPLFLQDAEGGFVSESYDKEIRWLRGMKSKETADFLENGRQRLLEAGIPSSQIDIKITEKKAGIARDILAELAAGYDAVLLSRQGTGRLREILLGSVSAKVLEKTPFLPIGLLGAEPPNRKIAIAFDGSEGSMNGIRFVGDMMGDAGYPVTLIHVFRTADVQYSDLTDVFISNRWFETAEKEMREKMEKASAYLVKCGIPKDDIHFRIVRDAFSRAQSIVEEAERDGNSIIVMGRRGLSRVEEFIMGRVSRKVVQLARNSMVWVIPEQYRQASSSS